MMLRFLERFVEEFIVGIWGLVVVVFLFGLVGLLLLV